MNNPRYLRNNLIDWFSQDKVQKMHFAVVGCGAVGNEVVKNLTLLGVGAIDVFDFDTIEPHNLTKSVLFRETDIGRNKADVVAERANQLDPYVRINSFPGDFWDKMSLDMLQKYTTVISCVDNFEARVRLNQLCLLFSKDFLNTGIDSRFVSVEVFPYSKLQDTACYECNLHPSVYERIANRYSCGWLRKVSFKEKIIPTTPITASLAGAITTSYALRLDNLSLDGSKQIFLDSITGVSKLISLSKNDGCLKCACRSKNVVVYKASSLISSNVFGLINNKNLNISINTSEPILTKFRCLDCSPNEKDSSTIFDIARKFDTSISVCKKCGGSRTEITIKDQFSIRDLLRHYKGYNFPCKFVSAEIDDKLIIFDLEENNECNNQNRRPAS